MGTMAGWVTRRRTKSQQEEFVIAKAYNHGAADGYEKAAVEIAALRARVAELEEMVPRWVQWCGGDFHQLIDDGWKEVRSKQVAFNSTICLMIPPIPPPESAG